MWKKFVSDYLTFSRKDRTGILVLLSLMVITLLAPLAFPYLKKEQPSDNAENEKIIHQLKAAFSDTSTNSNAEEAIDYEMEVPGLFYFDPNTATIDDWEHLGIKKNVAITIRKYLAKGGRFKSPEDLKKIYTLKSKDAERLIPYVRIRSSAIPSPSGTQIKYPETQVYNNALPSRKRYEAIDINEADTSAFIALPGIGSKLSQRIVNFREKLGGFIAVEQVGETRFLPDSTFQKIKHLLKLSNAEVKKININIAEFKQLNLHPYISYQVANAIVQYRNQNGLYKSLEDLKKIQIIDEDIFAKISPYLTIQ